MASEKKQYLWYFVIAVILFCTVLYFYRPLRSYIPFYNKFRTIVILVFRNPLCSFSDGERGLVIQACIEKNVKPLSDRSRLVNKDSEGYQLWETPKGYFWIPPHENLRDFFHTLAEQECKIYGAGKVGIRSDDIVLDCGANVGIFTREALHAGPKLVVAIEPSPQNIICLQRNFKTEVEQGLIIIYEKGVWNREEVLTFYTQEEDSGEDSFVISSKSSQKITVPVTTIDKLAKELKLDRVDFIKMDIEGAEENALIGAKETIAKYGPRIALSLEHIDIVDYEKKVGRMSNLIKSFYPNYQTQCGQCYIDREPEARIARLYSYVLFFY